MGKSRTGVAERFSSHVRYPYAELIVSRDLYPFFDGHRVTQGTGVHKKDVVVVPAVMAAEWILRASGAQALSDLRVLKGITLDTFDEGHEAHFSIAARESGPLIMSDESGRPRYAAHEKLLGDALTFNEHQRASLRELEAPEGDIYGGVLFHGSDFQVVRGVSGVGQSGLSATLIGARLVGWPGDEASYKSDPALLDGALQLALLWTEAVTGGASLPTSIGAIDVHVPGLLRGTAEALLVRKEVGDTKCVCDILITADGEPFVSLRGVTTHLLPS